MIVDLCGPSLTPGNHYFQTQSATDFSHRKSQFCKSQPNGYKPAATTDEPTLTSPSPSTTVNAVSWQCIAPATANTKKESVLHRTPWWRRWDIT
ncbi:hypothetical protein AVEN_229311-1 [Araneus ventricosus]|uniref:Uncharacterized protein n=1 Tax=Araneus ventricosus TaxID=182803 RepID=A0A4Y2WZ60_ARAVE|nr:hypothetical protein AVEN_2012-1 [Araneus ventricosus]GBO41808.1 hypothetical protein AVEN_37047-1 [Araneus ventricosus]GBO41830.1 hypothetical protein AVEN_229311-1 [Araneus ventricosus]